MDNKVTITVKKKTLKEVYNQVAMLNDMGFPNFQKGEPINDLMREIKRNLKAQKKEEDFGWKDCFRILAVCQLWCLGLLLLILWSATFGQ